MIRAWLELPPILIFVSLAAFYIGIIAILIGLTVRSNRTIQIRSLAGLASPFFASISILFALLTGFLANDISERNRSATRSVQVEAGEMRNIHTLSVAAASDMHDIRFALKGYINSVIVHEWPAMAQHQPAPQTDTAFDALLRKISDPQIAQASGQAVHAALLNAAIRLGTARSERLALAFDRTNTLKWICVLALGMITLVAIALVHLEHPRRAFITSLVVFGTAVIVVIGLVAMQEDPFRGAFRISPAPIERLQSLSLTVAPLTIVPEAEPSSTTP